MTLNHYWKIDKSVCIKYMKKYGPWAAFKGQTQDDKRVTENCNSTENSVKPTLINNSLMAIL